MSLIYRFVNIFEKSNLTDLSKNVNVTLFELKKRKPDASEEDRVSWNVEKLSNLLGRKNASYEVNDEFTKNKTNSQYSIFLDLLKSPSDYEKLYFKTIYGHGPPSRLLMLALNIFKKSNNNFKQKAKQIFSEISSILKIYHNVRFENRKDWFIGNIN